LARLNLTVSDHLRNMALALRWRIAPAEAHIVTRANLTILEVGDATSRAGTLFKETFSAVIPRTPRHFILVSTGDDRSRAFAYVHYARCGSAWLAGGLVSDAMRFRGLDRESADAVREEGGFAEWLMRASCAVLSGSAIFARIGDRRSETVNSRVGFQPTRHPHLWVIWKRPLSDAEKERVLDRVLAVGPF